MICYSDHPFASAGRRQLFRLCVVLLALGGEPLRGGGERDPAEPQLLQTPLTIEPTRSQVATLPKAIAEWRIAPATASHFEAVMEAGRFGAALASALGDRLEILPNSGEGLIRPDTALLDLFRPAERVLWWAVLAQHSANSSYRWPLMVRGDALNKLSAQPEFAEAARRVRAWGVSSGSDFLFGDLFGLEDLFSSEDSRERFVQTLLSVDTLFVRVVAEQGESGDPAAGAFWQGRGRSRSVESLLGATQLVEGRERIDVAHLLPRLARSLLHTFPPDFEEMAEPAVENAVVAASFFAPEFDSQALLGRRFGDWLEENAEPIERGRSFGDIVVFEDPYEKRWPFSMVYIADGLLFGRGPNLYAPWELVREVDIVQMNPRLRAGPARTYRIRSASDGMPEPDAPKPALSETTGIELVDLPAGPWGRLKAYELRLAPSSELLERQPAPERRPQWTFAGVTVDEIRLAIAGLDAPPEVRASLRQLFAEASPNRRGLITVNPSVELVRATPAAFRERLFRHLVHGAVATDYVQETVVATRKSPEAWLPPGTLPEELRRVALDLVYRRGDSLVLSDFGALYHAAPDAAQRHQLLRAVYATPVLVMLLERPERDEIPGLINYWRIDQQKSVGVLLQSFAGSSDMAFLDVVHLVPPLARELMNVYMHVLADSPVPSCYWTALNFAAEQPDSRLLTIPRAPGQEHKVAWERLQEEYVRVDAAEQLGDIIVYRRKSDGGLLHLCSFVAADVVYTKNGLGFSSPWCLMRLADVDSLYLRTGEVDRLAFRARD